jgi:hypothetical protein
VGAWWLADDSTRGRLLGSSSQVLEREEWWFLPALAAASLLAGGIISRVFKAVRVTPLGFICSVVCGGVAGISAVLSALRVSGLEHPALRDYFQTGEGGTAVLTQIVQELSWWHLGGMALAVPCLVGLRAAFHLRGNTSRTALLVILAAGVAGGVGKLVDSAPGNFTFNFLSGSNAATLIGELRTAVDRYVTSELETNPIRRAEADPSAFDRDLEGLRQRWVGRTMSEKFHVQFLPSEPNSVSLSASIVDPDLAVLPHPVLLAVGLSQEQIGSLCSGHTDKERRALSNFMRALQEPGSGDSSSISIGGGLLRIGKDVPRHEVVRWSTGDIVTRRLVIEDIIKMDGGRRRTASGLNCPYLPQMRQVMEVQAHAEAGDAAAAFALGLSQVGIALAGLPPGTALVIVARWADAPK